MNDITQETLKQLHLFYEQVELLNEADDEEKATDTLDTGTDEENSDENEVSASVEDITVLRKIYDALTITKALLDHLLTVVTEESILEFRIKLEKLLQVFVTYVKYYARYSDDERKKIQKLLKQATSVFLKQLIERISTL